MWRQSWQQPLGMHQHLDSLQDGLSSWEEEPVGKTLNVKQVKKRVMLGEREYLLKCHNLLLSTSSVKDSI